MSGGALVSVGLPVYNGANYLCSALDSLLSQTYRSLEVVVSDNASTDGTEAICRRYAEADSRVRYVRQERNIGANANFNEVLHLAQGEYFKWAAHDDVCEPTFLEECVRVLESDPQAVLCHTQTLAIDELGRPVLPTPELAAAAGFADLAYDRRPLRSGSPARRFTDILLHTRWCYEIFGVMRRVDLLRTQQQQGFYGTDKVILAELSLLGTFRCVPLPLWLRRDHDSTSTKLGLREKAAWSRPEGGRPVLPVRHMVAGYLRSVRRQSLRSGERARCYLGVLQLAARPDTLNKVLRPGPHNYFGITGRSRAPESAEALSVL